MAEDHRTASGRVSEVLYQRGNVGLRRMRPEEDDFGLMEKWLTDPELLKYYEGTDHSFTRQQVKDKFFQRTSNQDSVIACIVEYAGKAIGYMQYYEVDASTLEQYGVASETRSYGMDLFIGETGYWDQGIGTIIVKGLLEYLFAVEKASRVFIDPQTWNQRAIRCYEKSGFRKIKILPENEMHEGVRRDNWLMEISAGEWQG